MKTSVCIFIILLCFTTNVTAASFDCAKASTNIEKMICADDNLSKLDEELNTIYKQALSAETSKEELKKQQLMWLKKVRKSCKDAACLKIWYGDRIAVLTKSDSASKTVNNAQQTTNTSRTAKFNDSQFIGDWCSVPCYYAVTSRPYDLPCDFRITKNQIRWKLYNKKHIRSYEILEQTGSKEAFLVSGGDKHAWYSSESSPSKYKLVLESATPQGSMVGDDIVEIEENYFGDKGWKVSGAFNIKRGTCKD